MINECILSHMKSFTSIATITFALGNTTNTQASDLPLPFDHVNIGFGPDANPSTNVSIVYSQSGEFQAAEILKFPNGKLHIRCEGGGDGITDSHQEMFGPLKELWNKDDVFENYCCNMVVKKTLYPNLKSWSAQLSMDIECANAIANHFKIPPEVKPHFVRAMVDEQRYAAYINTDDIRPVRIQNIHHTESQKLDEVRYNNKKNEAAILDLSMSPNDGVKIGERGKRNTLLDSIHNQLLDRLGVCASQYRKLQTDKNGSSSIIFPHLKDDNDSQCWQDLMRVLKVQPLSMGPHTLNQGARNNSE